MTAEKTVQNYVTLIIIDLNVSYIQLHAMPFKIVVIKKYYTMNWLQSYVQSFRSVTVILQKLSNLDH